MARGVPALRGGAYAFWGPQAAGLPAHRRPVLRHHRPRLRQHRRGRGAARVPAHASVVLTDKRTGTGRCADGSAPRGCAVARDEVQSAKIDATRCCPPVGCSAGLTPCVLSRDFSTSMKSSVQVPQSFSPGTITGPAAEALPDKFLEGNQRRAYRTSGRETVHKLSLIHISEPT